MDKASKVLRRSSVKLRSMGGGHADLNMVISEIHGLRSTAKSFMMAQNSVAQDMLKWSSTEENRALQDCINQISELNNIWTDAQKLFIEELKTLKHQFEMVLEEEMQVDQACNYLVACEQKEIKIRKEKTSDEELGSLSTKLYEAEKAKDFAQKELGEKASEAEAIKLIRLKAGLQKITDAYVEMGNKCALIFESQKEVIQQLPDVDGTDLHDIKYSGSGITKQTVDKAKDRVQEYRRSAYRLVPSTSSMVNEPPPPYTPGSYDPHASIDSAQALQLPQPQAEAVTPTCPLYQDLPHPDDAESLRGAMAAAKI